MYDDDCPDLFCPLEGEGSGAGRGGRSKKEMPNRNSDVRCERSHRSLSVRDVGYEPKKTWTVVWGSTTQEGQRRLESSPILSR